MNTYKLLSYALLTLIIQGCVQAQIMERHRERVEEVNQKYEQIKATVEDHYLLEQKEDDQAVYKKFYTKKYIEEFNKEICNINSNQKNISEKAKKDCENEFYKSYLHKLKQEYNYASVKEVVSICKADRLKCSTPSKVEKVFFNAHNKGLDTEYSKTLNTLELNRSRALDQVENDTENSLSEHRQNAAMLIQQSTNQWANSIRSQNQPKRSITCTPNPSRMINSTTCRED